MNTPNTLTLLRIVLIPVFVVVYYLPWRWSHLATALIFALAAGTDWLDGYLARRWNQTSPLGAFLDPVADKLMVAVVLVVLLQKHPTVSLAVPAAIIIGREITVSALREWMAELGARSKVAVSFVGKYKTAAQMVALILMLYAEPIGGFDTYQVGFALLYAAAVLTIWSMCLYVAAAWPKLRTGAR
ncbi:MAG: CDP-diacylglycerol--glycerol-3-phosphate 3-phosphatidyltransferase [Gammaproteobacteria bacterium]|nr:CDP-diacylglycerol--glycerol-3-phosphate 3-phosphatidyltransferase [Gammaproteobacteria bacterium]